MKHWYLAASVVVALGIPASLLAQGGGNATGGTGGTGGGRGASTGSGSSSGGLAGNVNTTLLGNQVNLAFNSVFGTSATLANTTADNFAAYRPTGSGSGTGAGNSSFSGGSGITNSGFGSGTGGFSGTGTGAGTGARTGAGAGGLSSGGMTGTLGAGGAAGGLGGNRGGLGGGLNAGGLGAGGLGGGFGNRNMMGGGGFLGGGQGGFMGGAGMNNQQQNANQGTMGYQVNFGNNASVQVPISANLTPNIDYQQRLLTAPGLQGAVGLQVYTRGDTAILRGQVGSDYAKQLAAAMIRLEPGIYEVQNELVVVPSK